VVYPRQKRRATTELIEEGRPPAPEESIRFEATLGNFVSTRDGNILINLIVPGREAAEIAKMIRMYGYRIDVDIQARKTTWQVD
jgi:hypothetical protein